MDSLNPGVMLATRLTTWERSSILTENPATSALMEITSTQWSATGETKFSRSVMTAEKTSLLRQRHAKKRFRMDLTKVLIRETIRM
jgi:hypothetical protein